MSLCLYFSGVIVLAALWYLDDMMQAAGPSWIEISLYDKCPSLMSTNCLYLGKQASKGGADALVSLSRKHQRRVSTGGVMTYL